MINGKLEASQNKIGRIGCYLSSDSAYFLEKIGFPMGIIYGKIILKRIRGV